MIISCGSQSIRVSKRYSELLKFHEALQKSELTHMYGITLPKFPSKRRAAGKHLIDPLQVALRVKEFEEYFSELSKIPIILTLDLFHEMLGITALSKTDKAAAQLKEILEQCGHLALAATPARPQPSSGRPSSVSFLSSSSSSSSSSSTTTKKKKDKKKAKKLKKSSLSFSNDEAENSSSDEDDSDPGKSLLDKDFLYSQRFHLLAKSVVNCSSSSGAPPPSSVEQEQLMQQAKVAKDSDLDGTGSAAPIPALYFTHKLRFHLNSKFWASDRTIRESQGGRVWFTMVGPIPSVAVGKNPRMNDYFAIVNPTSSASPLMFMSISGEKSFTLWEAMSDGLVGSSVCTFHYDAPPPGSKDTMCYVMESESGNRQNITCSGVSARKSAFFQDLEDVCATVEMSPDKEDDLVVEISPHRDVLFYLIAVIAIQKLEDDEIPLAK